MKKLVIGLLMLGLASQGFAQEIDPQEEGWFDGIMLTGITVTPVLHDEYLQAVKEGVLSPLVLRMEGEVARYDVRESPIYNETAKVYKIVFKQDKGRILATFDQEGNLVHSFEKFKNIAFPEEVRNTLLEDHFGWDLHSNTYYVSYDESGELSRVYKINLEKDGDKKSIKLAPEGDYVGKEKT